MQYFDKCSPTSSAVLGMSTNFKSLVADYGDNIVDGHPNCENNASDLKNTKNNENITQLLDFSYCWIRHNDLFRVIFLIFFILDSTWNICYIRDLLYPTEMKIIFWKSKDRSASTKRKLTSFSYRGYHIKMDYINQLRNQLKGRKVQFLACSITMVAAFYGFVGSFFTYMEGRANGKWYFIFAAIIRALFSIGVFFIEMLHNCCCCMRFHLCDVIKDR